MTTKKTTKSGKATKPASAAKAAAKSKPKAEKAASTVKAAAPKRSRTKAAITKPGAAAKAARVAPASATASTELTKKALVERFMEETGMKKGEARKAVDAMLVVLHGAIHEGRDMAVAPLGKIKVVRKKETPNGELAVLRVKLRDPDKMPASGTGNLGIADAAE